MKRGIGTIILHLVILLIIITSCDSNRLINDRYLKRDIQKRFKQISSIADKRKDELLQIFSDNNLGRAEREGLKFYLASMPLSDLADYNSSFYLANIRKSIQARTHFPWSSDIPDHIFLHYVLPIRVNNENLDSFRIKYYNELAGRLEGFNDIEEAALEINHWCHEKVSYQGADIRTSSPMATILSARGRCGEESTLTVAALRTVGIPARQVYVPRWSHSDDNHAWVEVWISGEWKYMGACEPEPVMNHGWFTEAASRSMLINTKSFGKYYGNENIVRKYKYYSEINNLGMYAITKDLTVRVLDTDNKPVRGAEVRYGLYNYAEFYPVAATITDASGITSLTTGLGSLMVWCSENGKYGFDLVSVSENDSLTLIIGGDTEDGTTCKFSLKAPDPSKKNPGLTDKQVIENRRRLMQEDSIRQRYIDSWIDTAGIHAFADISGYNFDDLALPISRSMGNYRAIISFLDKVDVNNREDALALLNYIAEKDLRDTPGKILMDHLENARKFHTENLTVDIFNKYVLNPRIANEIISPWRGFLQQIHDFDTIMLFKKDPGKIADWIDDNVQIDNERNYYNVPLSPRGSIELGLTDHQSRNILFVALCRSYGIPARLAVGKGNVQYFKDGKWFETPFCDEKKSISGSARLTLSLTGKYTEAEYNTDFSLARITQGNYKTLDYGQAKNINDFDWPLRSDPGKYMLVCGKRFVDNEILSEILFFELAPDESREINFSLPDKKMFSQLYKTISPGYKLYDGEKYISLADTNGKGMLIAWLNHDNEPTKHFLSELTEKAEEFNKWGGRIYLVTDSTSLTESWDLSSKRDLPDICLFAFESSYKLLTDLFPDQDQNNILLPFVILINPQSEVIYKSEGYQIGLTDQILTIINQDKSIYPY